MDIPDLGKWGRESMETNYILEMRHISKSFPGVKALDDVTLCVRPGTVHSLMGENGAGKSTLMNCLFGIYSIDSGEIILDGKEVAFHSPSEALNNHVDGSPGTESSVEPDSYGEPLAWQISDETRFD